MLHPTVNPQGFLPVFQSQSESRTTEKEGKENVMKKYTVTYWTPYISWENVEAKSEAEAINKIGFPPYADLNEPGQFTAKREDEAEMN
jgi:hypothetical protein